MSDFDRPNRKSILWEGSTTRGDFDLLHAIAKKIVVGDDAHRDKCVNKMLDHISESAWQEKYTHRNFVFSIYYAQGINLIEISSGLSAQAVDALYFLMTRDVITSSLADKLRYVFKEVYGHKMPYQTAQAIRVLRNNIMHTGAIFGIEDASKAEDKQILDEFCDANRPTNQIMSNQQILIGLAGGFSYLMQDLVVRVLGLEWEDLSFNLAPPSRRSYFDGRPKTAL